MRLHCVALIAVALSACSSAEDIERATGVERQAAVASSEAESGGARAVAEVNELYEFNYSYPAQAGAIPELRRELDARLDRGKAELVSQAETAKREAAAGDFPFRMHGLHVEWQTVADLPDWLSLSAEIATYSGGAHGNVGYDSLLWDRREGVLRQPRDLFVSPGALQQAVERRWCAALNEQRERKRGMAVDPTGEDMFDQCPGVDELTVLLGSSNGRTFDRIGLIAGPYVAGPYAEGTYEVTLPVDMAVLDAVKREYDGAFSLKR